MIAMCYLNQLDQYLKNHNHLYLGIEINMDNLPLD